jgi:hypothetical protein
VRNDWISPKKWRDTDGIQLAMKYQIKEVFWEDENESNTTIYRNKVWSELDKLDARIKSKSNKIRIKSQKRDLINKMKPMVKEEAWIEFLQTIEKDKFPDFYVDTYPFTPKLCNLQVNSLIWFVEERKHIHI